MKLREPIFPCSVIGLNFGQRSSTQALYCNVRARLIAIAAYGLTQVLCACTASSQAKPQAARSISEPGGALVQEVPRTVITPTRAATLEELFAEAQKSLQEGKAEEAAAQFDRIVQLEPEGVYVAQALLQSGLAYEQFDQWEKSALRFEKLAETQVPPAMMREALVRSVRVRLHLGHWRQGQVSGEALLRRYPNAPPLQRIVAHTGWSLGALHSGDLEQADYHVAKGLSVVEKLSLDRAGRIPRDVAVLYFALGESRRVRVEAAHLDATPSEFARSLEQRSSRLLEAQSAYSDSMRAHDAHWSTLSGLRVGQLYADLHKELLAIPPPRAVKERQQSLFEGAMRERYSVLLNKALTMIEHTVAMAERTGVAPEWRERALKLRVELESAVTREQKILDSLPYTRLQLRQALKALAKRAQ